MNVSKVKNCYGCGLCAVSCKKELIDIVLNKNGFYEPFLKNENACTNCGLCFDVCSFSHNELSKESTKIKSFASWSVDKLVRRRSTSGGVCFELGRAALQQGWNVCGVRYNVKEKRAEHFLATTESELLSFVGSKYIQSFTPFGLKQIDKKKKNLVFGTPCQIDSFRRFIKKFRCEDNFVLVDTFCHGVPSMLLWQKYEHEIEKKIGQIENVAWRCKYSGWKIDENNLGDDSLLDEGLSWRDSYNMKLSGKKGKYEKKRSSGDAFFRLFLGNVCLGKACYKNCKFKYDQTSADIRIGDFWGKLYEHETEGVCSVLVTTEQGFSLLKKSNCKLISHPLNDVAEGQMKKSPSFNFACSFFQFLLKTDISILNLSRLCWIYTSFLRLIKILKNPNKIVKKMSKVFAK